MRLTNPTFKPVTRTVLYRATDGGNPCTVLIDLAPGEVVDLHDFGEPGWVLVGAAPLNSEPDALEQAEALLRQLRATRGQPRREAL